MLSVSSGVGGCLCTSSISVVCMVSTFCLLKNNALSSFSAAEFKRRRMILHRIYTGSLMGEEHVGGAVGF